MFQFSGFSEPKPQAKSPNNSRLVELRASGHLWNLGPLSVKGV